jgi:hypothetical protein
MPYPSGEQCISIQMTSSINQTVQLKANTPYTLSFSACGRNCCDGSGQSNPINIQLYTTSDGWVQNIYQFQPPVNEWTNYTTNFSVQATGTYKLFFSGTWTSSDRSTAIQNIQLNSSGSSSDGSYSYESCEQAAISSGYKYFGLQNVNTQSGLGYCAVSNSEPAVTQYGTSTVPNKAVALWASNTASSETSNPGSTAILTMMGSLQVLNSGGQSVYSSPSTNANPSNYLGCYNDCVNGLRYLPTFISDVYGPTGSSDYDTCSQAAKNGGWSYFGLQWTQSNQNSQCFVGNDLTLARQAGKATNCTILNNIPVGGGCSNAVYATDSTVGSFYFLILQDDGNMCVYRGTGPNDNPGLIWATETNGKQQTANPKMAASNGKYGQNWIASGSTLAPGDFIGSTNGNLALVMQTDGNLVLYTYEMATNCQKMSDGNMGGGVGANAAYNIGVTSITGNIGKLAFIDADSKTHVYPTTNQMYSSNYSTVNGINTWGNDIPGAAFGGSTVDQCTTACNNNPDCAGFIFDTGSNMCWPKTSNMYPYGGPVGPNTSTNLYIRSQIPKSPPLGVSQNTNNTDTVTYQNYVDGGSISNEYGLSNATSVQKQQLQQLQSRLNLLSKGISDLTTNFQKGTMSAEYQSGKNVTGIQNYLKDINKTNIEIGSIGDQSSGNIQNILNDSDIVVLQKNYSYLLWSILAAGTVLVSMNIVKKQ